MNKYKILFIDEETESFDDFRDFVEKSSKADEIDIITQLPLDNLEAMMEEIIKLNPDAIISDFRLNEKKIDIQYNVPYNGAELVQEFLLIREGFPCFVLTAFDDLAVNESEDVNKVYVKNILHNKDEEGKARATFLDRVIIQIKHYKARLENAEEELTKLIALKEKGEANYDDEQRIIELDNFLEKAIDKRGVIPDNFKESSNTEKLGHLLNKVDELINKLENKSDE
jgi:hypothetical protein